MNILTNVKGKICTLVNYIGRISRIEKKIPKDLKLDIKMHLNGFNFSNQIIGRAFYVFTSQIIQMSSYEHISTEKIVPLPSTYIDESAS